jgi:hypothetical protein
MLARMQEQQNLYSLLKGMQISANTIEVSKEVPQKLTVALPCGPAVLLLDLYWKESKPVSTKVSADPWLLQDNSQ